MLELIWSESNKTLVLELIWSESRNTLFIAAAPILALHSCPPFSLNIFLISYLCTIHFKSMRSIKPCSTKYIAWHVSSSCFGRYICICVCITHCVLVSQKIFFVVMFVQGVFSTKKAKRKKVAQPKWRNLIYCKLLEKIFLVGCNLFFIIVLNIARNI